MKIGFFTSIEGWGGSETYLLSLMQGLREAGHQPLLYGVEGARLFREATNVGIECIAWTRISVPDESAPPARAPFSRLAQPCDKALSGTEAARNIHQRGYKGWLLNCLPSGVKLLMGNAREVLHLRRLFRRHGVKVMHVNLNGYEMAGVACRLCGIPVLGWHCIMPFRDPDATRRWLLKWTCRSYTLMGGMSHACIDAWQKLSGFPKERCRMVWNGIDLARYSGTAAARREVESPFIVLAVGRLHPMKGFDILIRAVGLTNDHRIRLILAGEGPSEEELKGLARLQPCAGNIIFAGHRDDMEALYREAHCLALPSVSHESFGFVLAEAMAQGIPLVTSDYGPLPEINIPGETGLVVPAGDVAALAEALRSLVGDPETCMRMGQAGQRRAKTFFQREKMVVEMIALYATLGR